MLIIKTQYAYISALHMETDYKKFRLETTSEPHKALPFSDVKEARDAYEKTYALAKSEAIEKKKKDDAAGGIRVTMSMLKGEGNWPRTLLFLGSVRNIVQADSKEIQLKRMTKFVEGAISDPKERLKFLKMPINRDTLEKVVEKGDVKIKAPLSHYLTVNPPSTIKIINFQSTHNIAQSQGTAKVWVVKGVNGFIVSGSGNRGDLVNAKMFSTKEAAEKAASKHTEAIIIEMSMAVSGVSVGGKSGEIKSGSLETEYGSFEALIEQKALSLLVEDIETKSMESRTVPKNKEKTVKVRL